MNRGFLKTLRFFHLINKKAYKKRMKKYAPEYRAIAKSPLFDAKWYLEHNPDVAAAKADPVEHYLTIGWKEDRPTSPYFDGQAYLRMYSDVAGENENPLLHYELFGKNEGRKLKETCNVALQKKMPRKDVFFSVIVASYNYRDYIQETLDSLVNQTYTNFEVIVVDDGSTDDSVEVIQQYVDKYPFIHLYRHPNGENKGLPATVKLGVEKSKGEYIAFCESDDYWTANHLAEVNKLITSSKNVKIVVNDVSLFGDGKRAEYVERNLMPLRRHELIKSPLCMTRYDFRIRNWIVTFSAVCVKKKQLNNVDILNNPRPANEDWWLWRQVCYGNKIYYIDKQLTAWRMHNSYMTKDSAKTDVCDKQRLFLEECDKLLDRKGNFMTSFSVIMPTYNRKKMITNAIDSLLCQSYKIFELIIVDDGSTDGTDDFLKKKYEKEISSGIIRYFYQKNSGCCKARNFGLKMAKNDWIAYLDSDNELANDFLKTMASAIECNPNAKTFYGKFHAINSDKDRIVGQEFDFNCLISENFIDLGVFVHHRSVGEQLGGFDENMTRLVDYDLITRYVREYKPIFIDKIIMKYNDGNESDRISKSGNLMDNWNYYKIKNTNFIKVSTIITSFNHEKYIEQAIESAITQQGNFIHEIIISDDGSSDETPKIIEKYAIKYPHLIRNISEKRNVGISKNMKKCIKEATGKYIFICEGDDYWCDVFKIKKQIEFSEKHGYSFVFNDIKIFNEEKNTITCAIQHKTLNNELCGWDALKAPELSLPVTFSCCMFDSKILKNIPEILYEGRLSEIGLFFYFEKFSKIGYIPQAMTVYRQHKGSVWSGASEEDKKRQKIRVREVALAVCRKEYKKTLEKIIAQLKGTTPNSANPFFSITKQGNKKIYRVLGLKITRKNRFAALSAEIAQNRVENGELFAKLHQALSKQIVDALSRQDIVKKELGNLNNEIKSLVEKQNKLQEALSKSTDLTVAAINETGRNSVGSIAAQISRMSAMLSSELMYSARQSEEATAALENQMASYCQTLQNSLFSNAKAIERASEKLLSDFQLLTAETKTAGEKANLAIKECGLNAKDGLLHLTEKLTRQTAEISASVSNALKEQTSGLKSELTELSKGFSEKQNENAQDLKQKIQKAQTEARQNYQELNFADLFHDTTLQTAWLKDKSFTCFRGAANYSFLYTLFRVLDNANPQTILEMGMGQTSKLTTQYAAFKHPEARLDIVENDKNWIDLYSAQLAKGDNIRIHHQELEFFTVNGIACRKYADMTPIVQDTKYQLIVVDGPFGADQPQPRTNIIGLIDNNNLADDFVIIFDDAERAGEQDTIRKTKQKLSEKGIKFVEDKRTGIKTQILLLSESRSFINFL